MDSKNISGLLISQIPLLLMTISNGTNPTNLLPIIVIPVIIYFIGLIPEIINYFRSKKIPSEYVKYYLDDGMNDVIGKEFQVNFINNLSVFLNDFNPESIKNGVVKNYQKTHNPNLLYTCVKAIISPDESYFCKFVFGNNIVNKIIKTGFVFPKTINLQNLRNNPIYISYEIIKEAEKRNTNGKNDDKAFEIEKERV